MGNMRNNKFNQRPTKIEQKPFNTNESLRQEYGASPSHFGIYLNSALKLFNDYTKDIQKCKKQIDKKLIKEGQ